MGSGAGKARSSASKYTAAGAGAGASSAEGDKAPETVAAGTVSAGGSSSSTSVPKRSKAAAAVAEAKLWSKTEIEQLEIPQLCRWLEALGTNYETAVYKDIAASTLWAEIEKARPPALVAVTSLDHVRIWPVPEMMKWLEYFQAANEKVASKEGLVKLVLQHGEELPPPTFLGESAEDAFITQVTQHIGLVKNAATTLLARLAQETVAVEEQERSKHSWHPNGKILADFSEEDLRATFGNTQAGFLEVKAGEVVDLTVHEASGWAWCIKDDASGGAQGWVPTMAVTEVARVVEDYSATEQGTEELAARKGDQMEVALRHYSGWSLCRQRSSDPEVAPIEGWLPDSCLSDHPRNAATKRHRLVLNGLQSLADDSAAVEAAFYQFRLQGPEATGTTLHALYDQVLALVEEYRNICHVMQTYAEADEAAWQEQQAKEAEEAERQRAADEAWLGLPGWVVEGKKAYWVSKVQRKWLRVHIKQVCRRRRKVLVTFESDPKARKVVSFEAFEDMPTCPLQRKKSRRKKNKDRDNAQEVLDDANDDINDELRALVTDLGGDRNMADEFDSSDSDSSDEDDATTASTSSEAVDGGVISSANESAELSAKAGTAGPEQKLPAGVDGLSEASQPDSEERQKSAAATLVAAARCFSAMRLLWHLRASAAAVRLQSWARGLRARRETQPKLVKRQQAAERIQGLLKIIRARRQREAWRLSQAEFERISALTIQRWARGHAGRKVAKGKRKTREHLALLVQALARKMQARRRLRECVQEDSATMIQKWARGRQSRARVQGMRARRDLAARRIQGLVFILRARQRLRVRREEFAAMQVVKAIKLQSWWRGEKARKYVRELFPLVKARHNAALRIQGLGRIRRARKHLRRLREERAALEARSATLIQAVARGRAARRLVHPKLQARQAASVRIQGLQKMWHARCILRKLQAERLKQMTAASIVIQGRWRGWAERRRLKPILAQKRAAAVTIQGLSKIRRARLLARRIRAAICIQTRGRAMLARRRVERRRRLFNKAALCIQRHARGRATRRRILPVLQQRHQAVVRLQAWRRGILGRRRAKAVRRDRAALHIECAWRRVLAHRELLKRRSRKVMELLDNLVAESVASTDQQPANKDGVWLENVRKALDWKDTADLAEEEKEWQERRLAAMEVVPADTPVAAQSQLSIALDRNLAAAAMAKARGRLRNRAFLLTQVDSSVNASCEEIEIAALRPEESLLARLSVGDACNEVASLLHAAWVITVASKGRRPQGVPKPDDVMKESLRMLLRRLSAEIRITKKDDKGEANETALRLLTKAEGTAIATATDEVAEMKARCLKVLKDELAAACQQGKEAYAAANKLREYLDAEVKAVQAKFDGDVAVAIETFRKERLELHAQNVALHELTMTMQVEKERLEAELGKVSSAKGPRAKVFMHVIAQVKALQDQVREQEVNGTSNRTSQSLLNHGLRALGERAQKGLEEALRKLREHGLKPESDTDPVGDFKLSDAVRKKQDKHLEEERLFKVALESEVAKLQAKSDAEKKKEIAILGARIRADLEKHRIPLQDALTRLLAWRDRAAVARPWLGELISVAKSRAAVTATSDYVRVAVAEQAIEAKAQGVWVDGMVPAAALRAAYRRMEMLLISMKQWEPEQSPRPGESENWVASLGKMEKTIADYAKKFPDVTMEELEAMERAAGGSPSSSSQQRPAKPGNISEIDKEGDLDPDDDFDSPLPEQTSPSRAKAAAAPPRQQSIWASTTSVAKSMLPDTVGGGGSAASASGSAAPRRGGASPQTAKGAPPSRPIGKPQPSRPGTAAAPAPSARTRPATGSGQQAVNRAQQAARKAPPSSRR